MKEIITIVTGLVIGGYLSSLLTWWLQANSDGFIMPKSLWRLVPFRVAGWQSSKSGITYKLNWVWDDLSGWKSGRHNL